MDLFHRFAVPLPRARGRLGLVQMASPWGKLSAQLTEGVTARSNLSFPCKSKYVQVLVHGPLSALRATPGDATGIPRFAPPHAGLQRL